MMYESTYSAAKMFDLSMFLLDREPLLMMQFDRSSLLTYALLRPTTVLGHMRTASAHATLDAIRHHTSIY